VDLFSDPVDIVIRMGESPNSNLIARKLASFKCGLYASPRYLELSGEPTDPAKLTIHQCLRMRGPGADRWTLSDEEGSEQVTIGGRFELNSAGMLRRLVSVDLAIALLPEGIAAQDVASGALR
jgi:DNA-binding transcriptional LysR family regulator